MPLVVSHNLFHINRYSLSDLILLKPPIASHHTLLCQCNSSSECLAAHTALPLLEHPGEHLAVVHPGAAGAAVMSSSRGEVSVQPRDQLPGQPLLLGRAELHQLGLQVAVDGLLQVPQLLTLGLLTSSQLIIRGSF